MAHPPRCYLHVGSPKTGTTFLQSVLWGSRAALAQQGLRLPMRGLGDHFYLTLWVRGMLDPETDRPDAVNIERRLRADLAANRNTDILISHELLAAAEPERVGDLLSVVAGYELHVIVTARDLHRQLPAEWQQHVKTRYRGRYGRFLNDVMDGSATHFWRVQDVPAILRLWGDGLPPERIHVVTVPPRGSAPDELLRRFCSVIGIDPATVDTSDADPNPSLGYAQTELLRRVNVAIGDNIKEPRNAYPATVKIEFAERLLTRQTGRPLGLPKEQSDWALERSRAMVDELRAMGCDVVGDLDELVGTPSDDFDLEVPESQVSEAAVEAIAAMLTQRWQQRWKGRRGHASAEAPTFRSRVAGVVRRLRG